MPLSGLRLLVLSDAHFSLQPQDIPQRLSRLGKELVRRVLDDALLRGGFDAVALLGDLVDDGSQPCAQQALEEMLGEVRKTIGDRPLLVAPGNHDYSGARLPAPLNGLDNVYEFGGYRFIVFADAYREDDSCVRSEADRARFRALAAQPGGPIVALQHNPLTPEIDSDYPFLPLNSEAVKNDYAQAGVVLSLSGHYHDGLEPRRENGVIYFTVPAVCEAPYRYAIVTLRGREVKVEARSLYLPPTPRVIDTHCHTEFAYCCDGVTADIQIDRAKVFGLAGLYLVEHGPQLYCTAEEFWAGKHVQDPSICAGQAHNRMAEFRRQMEPRRGKVLGIGLEVEVGRDGRMILHEEDRDWPDLLVGAIHWLPEPPEGLSIDAFAKLFMKTNEHLLAGGVDILAHPFRVFRRWGHRPRKEDHRVLAEMLAATHTAAEINCHINDPDPAFFAECIERGVKISLGSDAHRPYEACAFQPHLALLRQAAGQEEVGGLLYQP